MLALVSQHKRYGIMSWGVKWWAKKRWSSTGNFPWLASALWVPLSALTLLVAQQEGHLSHEPVLTHIGVTPEKKEWLNNESSATAWMAGHVNAENFLSIIFNLQRRSPFSWVYPIGCVCLHMTLVYVYWLNCLKCPHPTRLAWHFEQV